MMWGYGMGGLWMIVFWVGIVLVIAWAIQSSRSEGSTGPKRSVEILEERYARGEVDRDEFLSRRSELES